MHSAWALGFWGRRSIVAGAGAGLGHTSTTPVHEACPQDVERFAQKSVSPIAVVVQEKWRQSVDATQDWVPFSTIVYVRHAVQFFKKRKTCCSDPHFMWQAKHGCRALVPWEPWPRESRGSRRIRRAKKGLVLKPAQHCAHQVPPPRKQNQQQPDWVEMSRGPDFLQGKGSTVSERRVEFFSAILLLQWL